MGYFEVELDALLEAAKPRTFAGLSKYPSTTRDITVLVPESVSWQIVGEALRGFDVRFVDDYYGDEIPAGHKSLTLRLTLTDPARTPTEAQAAELEKKVRFRLERKLGAKLRG